jgi:hypothetical protein
MSAEVLGNELRAGQGCPHASAQGCGVYPNRPVVPCRTFVCSWLVEGSPLPDWMRPDLSGAIVLLSMPWEGEKVISAIPVGQAIPDKTLDWLKQYAQKHSRPLVFYERTRDEQGRFNGLKRLGFGPPEFRAKVARLLDSNEKPSVPMQSA